MLIMMIILTVWLAQNQRAPRNSRHTASLHPSHSSQKFSIKVCLESSLTMTRLSWLIASVSFRRAAAPARRRTPWLPGALAKNYWPTVAPCIRLSSSHRRRHCHHHDPTICVATDKVFSTYARGDNTDSEKSSTELVLPNGEWCVEKDRNCKLICNQWLRTNDKWHH